MKIILICLLSVTILTCNRSPERAENWAQALTGTVGNEKVVVFLNKGDHFDGYLWLGNYPYPLAINQNFDSTSNGNFNIHASEAQVSIQISATMEGNSISGKANIVANDTSKTVPIILSVSDDFTGFEYFYSHFEKNAGTKKRPVKFRFSSGTIWADGSSDLSKSIKTAIQSLANADTSQNPQTWIAEDRNNLLENWEAALQQSDDGFSAPEEMIKNIGVFHEDGSIITLASFIYEYSGGAHGMHYTQLINVDKKTGNALELADILSENEIELLPSKLEKIARERFGANNTQSLRENGFFVDSIQPTPNYYLLEQGIGFYYSLYELRPYAEGEVILFVPFEQLGRISSKAGIQATRPSR